MKPGTLLKFWVLVFLLSPVSNIAAQSDVGLYTRKAQLKDLAQSLKARDVEDRRQAMAAAKRLGIPLRRELPNGRLLELQRIAPGIGPIFYTTYNVDAADTVSTDEVWPGGGAGLTLDGAGLTIGEWDGGAVQADHDDLAGRVTQVDGVTTVSEHATHVAGTLIGAGEHPFYPQARGMAYAANLDAYDWNSDTAEMALAAANGMLVSNHSYGIAAGWLYLGDLPPDAWWWIGGEDPSIVEDANFGYYDSEAQLWDQIAYDAPYYLITKASGNDRWDVGPVAGEVYTIIDQDGYFVSTSTEPRNPDCAPAGYDCLPGHSVAKNILTVGAVDDITDGYAQLAGPSQVQMTGFSGWGPTDDGRIKPDLVGNGMWLVSTWPQDPGYAAALGTSMATPNVSGSLLLLQEHFHELNGSYMRAATLKALAIHTADEAGSNEGPDYAFGWGLLNTGKAAGMITANGGDHQIIEGTLANGGSNTVGISVSDPDAIVKATLVWTDPPGTPVAPSLDPPDLMLVNDLDLRIKRGPSNWLPWVLNPASPAAAAARADNFRDNVEQVVAEVTRTGTHDVVVQHKGTLLGGNPQDYSLVISILPPAPQGATAVFNEDFSGGMPAGWTVETERGVSWTIQSSVQGDDYLENQTGGSGNFAMVNNAFINTVTSLVSPTMDLSTATNAVLRFDSSFWFSDQESINVDYSTDGGSSWTNDWSKVGLLPFPYHYDLDLTGEIAGHANARIRFRYHTFNESAGYFWQIDNVILDAYFSDGPPPVTNPPAAASDPFPADSETDLAIETVVNWTGAPGADSHDVYFGTSSPPPLQSSQGGTGYDPGVLDYDTTYYWRVDEVNAAGTTTGTEWQFTTGSDPGISPPGPATSPAPSSGAIDVAVDTTLAWQADSEATSHDVYFGTEPSPALIGNQGGSSFDPGPLQYETTYYWRIDEVNSAGTTGGTVWHFTTVADPGPPPPGQAANPVPANGATAVERNTDLAWTAGIDAASHDLYFGTSPSPALIGNQGGSAYDPGMLSYNTTYYWRVDEVNDSGTTTGLTWSFTTELPPPAAIHLESIAGSSTPGTRGRWTATVTVTVTDDLAVPVSGITMDGEWSGGTNGGASCETNGSGQCSVSKANLKSNVASVVFTANSLAGTNVVHTSEADTPDNPITVFKDAPPANQAPNATPDDYATTVDAGFSDNVLANDNRGYPEATVTDPGAGGTTTLGGSVSMSSNGDFTYTPPPGIDGTDDFSYTLTNSEGSDTGLVTIEISADDPGGGGGSTLTATPRRDKGTWYVDLAWEPAEGTVYITRDGVTIAAPVDRNTGAFTDNVGKKPPETHDYGLCDMVSNDCEYVSVSF